jgi:hypothetical protein
MPPNQDRPPLKPWCLRMGASFSSRFHRYVTIVYSASRRKAGRLTGPQADQGSAENEYP